jgi:hypothetical protein
MRCEWCNESDLVLIKGYCFECHSMAIINGLGYHGSFEDYQGLSTITENMHCLTYVLKDTLFLFGNASTRIH